MAMMHARALKASLALACVLLTAAPARAADAPPSEAANNAFLIANMQKPGVVTLPSRLQYRVLRSGFGRHPAPTDVVRVFFNAHLIDGSFVDGTSPGLPATLALNSVIAGLSEALMHMHEGDEWQVVVPPSLGPSSHTTGNASANQVLVFDLTLVAAIPAAAAPEPDAQSPLSISGSNNRQNAMLTIHP